MEQEDAIRKEEAKHPPNKSFLPVKKRLAKKQGNRFLEQEDASMRFKLPSLALRCTLKRLYTVKTALEAAAVGSFGFFGLKNGFSQKTFSAENERRSNAPLHERADP